MTTQKRTITFKWKGKDYEQKIDGELGLSDLTPDEAKNALLRGVGQYAYYRSLKADAQHMQAKINDDYEFWQNNMYDLIDKNAEYTKKTEGWKKSHISVFYTEDWKGYRAKIIDIEFVVNKLRLICDSYEHLIRVLQSILATMRIELQLLHLSEARAKGAGDLIEDEKTL